MKEKNKEGKETLPLGFKCSFHRSAQDKDFELRQKLLSLENKNKQTRSAALETMYSTSDEIPRVPMLYQDPLWDSILLMFPEDNLKEVNKRLRHYYKYHPYFGNIIDIHSEFPLSDFELQIDSADEVIQKEYNYIKENLNLLEMCICMLRDRWLLGESIFIGNWDISNSTWEDWVQYPPEYIDVRRVPGTNKNSYTILPDPEVTKMINSGDPIDTTLSDIFKKYNENLYYNLSSQMPTTVSSNRVIHFANRPAWYMTRGNPLTKRCLKDLMKEDKLNNLQLTFYDRHLYPIKIFKIGSREKGWLPGKKHYDKLKELLVAAANDPDFNIVYHFGLEVDYIGTKDKIENLIPHFEYITKRILAGSFMNESLMSGEGPSYASQVANMKLLFHKYLNLREGIERILRMKVFLPIAISRNYIKVSEAEISHGIRNKNKLFSDYYLPTFFWKRNLLNNTTQQDYLMRLREEGSLPFKYICDVFGLDKESVIKYRKQEESTNDDNLYKEALKEFINSNDEVRIRFLKGEKIKDIIKSIESKENIKEEINKGKKKKKEKEINTNEENNFNETEEKPNNIISPFVNEENEENEESEDIKPIDSIPLKEELKPGEEIKKESPEMESIKREEIIV